MDAMLIDEVGQALWGPAWKGPMAEAVRHQKSAVADWASGRVPVPAGVWSELKKNHTPAPARARSSRAAHRKSP